jgi:hypothetical protein
MSLKHFPRTLFIVALLIFVVWLVYWSLFPSKLYNPGQQIFKVQIVVSETPYFHFTGLDEPYHYVIRSQKNANDFRISDEAFELLKDNDSVSKAINEIKYGDTLFIYMDSTSINKLDKNTKNIEIIGLASNTKWIINPDNLEKYYRKKKLDNRFSLFVIAIIFYFIYTKGRKSKKEVQ